MNANEKKERALLIGVIVAALFATLIWAFWPSTFTRIDDLELYVKEDIQQQLDENISEYADYLDLVGLNGDLSVEDVVLVHSEGNKYHGIVELNISGITLKKGVDVITDGNTFVWELK